MVVGRRDEGTAARRKSEIINVLSWMALERGELGSGTGGPEL
jgi:hypothetical protein